MQRVARATTIQQLDLRFKVLSLSPSLLPVSSISSSSPTVTTISPPSGVRHGEEGEQQEEGRQRGRQRRRGRRIRQRNKDISLQRINLLNSICRNVTNTAIHILHNCSVDQEEMLILSLGLNFVPPPHKCNYFYLTEALQTFTRRIRIKKHFLSQQQDNTLVDHTTESLLHQRISRSFTTSQAEAIFSPPITKSPIENYIQTATSNVLTIGHTTTSTSQKNSNTRSAKWGLFHEVTNKLHNREDIVIKPADKNLGTVVMNRTAYITEALSERNLGNTNTYSKIPIPPDTNIILQQLTDICQKQEWLSEYKITHLHRDLITDFTHDRIKLCRMYFLPKLHKPTLAFRPICASINWITYWTSVYIHLSIFPLLKLIPSYITNSAKIVTMLDYIKPPKYFQFVEADVDNLYPSINIVDGLDALHTFLCQRSKFSKERISFIVNLTKWVLTNNYVSFYKDFFLQISGTAMGTPCAVVFACIYMHIIEQEALNIFASQRYIHSCVILFVRFIDDILAIFTDYSTAFEFMNILNSRRKNIKLTFKIRNMEAQFLDLTLYKDYHESLTIQVKAYSKPMNKFLFLPPTSCHPRHIFPGWILGYGKRVRLNCSDDKTYLQYLDEFQTRLLDRGYDQRLITSTFNKIPNRDKIISNIRMQDNPISLQANTKSIGIPFVVTYTPEIQQALPLISTALAFTEEAHLDPHFPLIFGTRLSPMLSFKRGPNLRDIVAPSTLPAPISQ